VSRIIFIVLLLAGAAYVALSCGSLPATVASHFDGTGSATGFMPRQTYEAFTLALLLGMPLLAVFGMSRAYRRKDGRLKLPNGDYWLAPERRERSVAFLLVHAQWFGCLLVLLVCRVHWMVLQANALQPPLLPYATAMGTLVLFFLGVAVWFGVLMLRFRRSADR